MSLIRALQFRKVFFKLENLEKISQQILRRNKLCEKDTRCFYFSKEINLEKLMKSKSKILRGENSERNNKVDNKIIDANYFEL